MLVMAFLKFGIPYSSNVSIAYPATWDEYVFFNWPLEILVFTGIGFLIVLVIKHVNRSVFQWNMVDVCVGLLMLGLSLAFMVNSDSRSGGIFTLLLFLMMGVFYAISRIMYQENRDTICLVYLATGISFAIALLYGLYQHVEGFKNTFDFIQQTNMSDTLPDDVMRRLRGRRIFSVFVYPNSFAAFLSVLVPFLFVSFKDKAGRYFYMGWYLGCIIFTFINIILMGKILVLFKILPFFVLPHVSVLYGLYLTKSKACFLIAAIALGVFLIHIIRKKMAGIKRGKNTFMLIPIFLLPLLVYFFRPGYFVNFLASLEVRIAYVESSINMLKDQAFMGFGPGSFGEIFLKYRILPAEEIQFAHQNFLQVWIEGGLISFMALCLVFYFAFRLCMSQFLYREQLEPLSFLLVLAAIHHCVDFDLYVPSLAVLQFVMLGTLVSVGVASGQLKQFGCSVSIKAWNVSMCIIVGLCLILLYVNRGIYLGGKHHYLAVENKNISDARQLHAASTHFQKAYAYFPSSPRILWDYARFAMQTRHIELAGQLFQECLRKSPRNALLWYDYALFLIYKGKYLKDWHYEAIVEALSEAVEKYPLDQNFRKTYSDWTAFVEQLKHKKS